MGSITLKAVEKWFDDVQVIKGVDLQITNDDWTIGFRLDDSTRGDQSGARAFSDAFSDGFS